ncbi:MAG TPA: FtsW/RodA/SpoVE family cell cycle protein [Candidatus Cloacimonetes bacterium]|jgi:cell division protein FtsW|nr:FtsW/RodA/SpoVE family cell cycle protein [Candidatus Cloacimonadota bacterium]
MKRNSPSQHIISYDWILAACFIALCGIGLYMMMNIASNQNQPTYIRNHIIFLAVSLVSTLIVFKFPNFSKMKWLPMFLIIVSIALLVVVLVMGTTTKGSTRAIRFMGIGFQPSFLARVALIFLFADHFSKKQEALATSDLKGLLKNFYPLIIITGLIYVLIYVERHLSTIVINAATLLTLTVYAGIRYRYVFTMLLIGVVAFVAIISFGAEFRSSRIEAYKTYFLLTQSESAEPNPSDYNVRESITALSRGGFFGTGVNRGRAKHSYLPEARTDYIFTVIGEECGFLGAFIVFALHCVLFFRAFKTANEQEDMYLKLLCAGLAMNIFYNVLVNTGVAMSIIPSTGNTLPFISYGGSALLIDSLSVGVILNIGSKRKTL